MSNMDFVAFNNSAVFQEYDKKLSEMDKGKEVFAKAEETLNDLKVLAEFEKLENAIKQNTELKEKLADLQIQLQDPEISKNFHPKFAEAIMMLNLEKA